VVFLVTVAVLQVAAFAREVDGTVPLIKGVGNRVYGTLRNSVLTVSNGTEERILAVDRHGHFHADLPEGTWKVIDIAAIDRKTVETGQTFKVPSGEHVLKIRVPMRLR
jgi:hypothetical protein